ncbi:MAG TPA: NAD(P)-binding protein [Papillibacter sp.]|nr:NAD(P)-binding protein [Papillibacter sp.]
MSLTMEQSSAYVENCIHGDPAACSCACPFRLDIRGFLAKVAKGRWAPAYKALRDAVVFPAVVAVLCHQPCRGACLRDQTGDEAIALGDIESAVVRFAKNRPPESYAMPPKSERIAVIGAGPAGLAAALALAQKKYSVTVFDKAEGWGGSLRTHPKFDVFDADFKLQFSNLKVEFEFNHPVTSLDDVAGFDAVYIATGKGGEDFGLLSTWDSTMLSTDNPKVFIGGELTGVSLMDAIAHGGLASVIIETYFKAGRAVLMDTEQRRSCGRLLDYSDAPSVPLIAMANPQGYSEEETKAEAARCLQCDCSRCMDDCEMLKWFRKKPRKLGQEVYTDLNVNPPFSTHNLTRQTFSCMMCGHCKSVCPTDVDIGALLQRSRTERVELGRDYPLAFHDYWLRELDFYGSDAFFAAPPKGKETCSYAFFPGCQLGANNPERVLKGYEYLSGRYDTGVILGCCGAPAYWAGDAVRLADNALKIKEVWERLGKPTLVFACTYCVQMFAAYLPDIPRTTIYELMAQDEALRPASPFPAAAIFDPCAAREEEDVQEAVRTLIGRTEVDASEIDEKFRCCGNGGHIRMANRDLYDEITDNRIRYSDKPYIVYCANCRETFSLKDKPNAHILDMALGLEADRPVPSLMDKKRNSLEVKKTLMKNLTGSDFTPPANEWDGLRLVIDPALLEEMDRKLITEDDVREAIYTAEKTGQKFVSEDGVIQCSMIKPVITYWVQYRPTDSGAYEVVSAYSHRMRFGENE